MARTMKDHLAVSLTVLKCLGLWTEERNYTKSKFFLFGLVKTVLFDGVYAFLLLAKTLTATNVEEFASSAYVSIQIFLTFSKSFLFLKKLTMFQELVRMMEDPDFQPRNKRQFEETNKIVKLYKGPVPLTVVLGFLIAFSWTSAPYFDGHYGRQLPFDAWFPYNHTAPIYYEFSYFYLSLCTFFKVMTNVGMDTLLACLLGSLAVECHILADILRNFHQFTAEQMKNDNEERKHERIARKMNDNLLACSNYHKKILRFSESIGSYCNVVVFIQFASSMVSVCLTMIKLTMLPVRSVIFGACLSYALGLLEELFLLCWFGTLVIEKSLEISNALYCCNWEDCSKEFKQNLIFFMMRTQRPIKIYALNFFSLSLEVAKWVLKTAWSCFTLLKRIDE